MHRKYVAKMSSKPNSKKRREKNISNDKRNHWNEQRNTKKWSFICWCHWNDFNLLIVVVVDWSLANSFINCFGTVWIERIAVWITVHHLKQNFVQAQKFGPKFYAMKIYFKIEQIRTKFISNHQFYQRNDLCFEWQKRLHIYQPQYQVKFLKYCIK